MSNIDEIKQLEEKLRLAELTPDPDFFQEHLDDNALMDGKKLKSFIVEAHRPGSEHKFTEVLMCDFNFIEHDSTVVVTCTGNFTGPKWSGEMKFMRVWHKKNGSWKIIAASTLK